MDSLHFISNEEVLIPNVQPFNIKSAQANKSQISNKVLRDLQIKQGTLIMKKKKKKTRKILALENEVKNYIVEMLQTRSF
jgi:hypothetical protein